jgi:hypothetical protein
MWRNFYCNTCQNLNHPSIEIKHKLFQNNNKIFLIIKSWNTWQHITCSHYSPKKSDLSCKQQYIYDQSKDENVFRWFLFSIKIRCCLRLVSMWLVQHDYWYFNCKCHLQLKIITKYPFSTSIHFKYDNKFFQ